jgi:hypothetical protein
LKVPPRSVPPAFPYTRAATIIMASGIPPASLLLLLMMAPPRSFDGPARGSNSN